MRQIPENKENINFKVIKYRHTPRTQDTPRPTQKGTKVKGQYPHNKVEWWWERDSE